DQTIDAGLYLPVTIGDFVWLDINSDGIQNRDEHRNRDELGVSGVTVKLLDDTGATTRQATTTDGSGHYSFTNLSPGTYQLQFVPLNGFIFTAPLQGMDSHLDSDANQTTGKTGPITLVSGQTDLTWDAGFLPINLSLTQKVDPLTPSLAPPLVGSRLVFTIEVSNAAGLSTATGVTVRDQLPSGLTYVSSWASQGSYSSSTEIWTVGTPASSDCTTLKMPSSGCATLEITATVTKAGTKTNFAEVLTANELDPNSTPGNGPMIPAEDDEGQVPVTPPGVFVIGPDKSPSIPPVVQIIAEDPQGEIVLGTIEPYGKTFVGGVRVATGDVDGDGIDEIVTAPGRGRAPEICVFKQNGTWVETFTAYAATFTYGIQLAIADVDGDGWQDLITVPSYGAAEVRIFWNTRNGQTPFQQTNFESFVAFPMATVGGWVISAGDMGKWVNDAFVNQLDNKAAAEIVVGTGPGIQASVRVFTRVAPQVFRLVQTVSPFTGISSNFLGGVSLDVAPINVGDLVPDIIVGAGLDGASRVEVYVWNNSSTAAAILPSLAFQAFTGSSNYAPVQIAAQDTNGDNIADAILAAQGPGGKTNQIVSFDITQSPPVRTWVSGGNHPGGQFITTVKGTVATVGMFEPSDVNCDGLVTALDVLVLINFLNANATVPRASSPPPYDVNRDGAVTPQDVLLVISYLNKRTTGMGEGEGEAAPAVNSPPEPGGLDPFGSLGAVGSPTVAISLQPAMPALTSPTAARAAPLVASSPANHDAGQVLSGASGNGRDSLPSDARTLEIPDELDTPLDRLELTLADIAEDVQRWRGRAGETA
ncbi:MAG: dockerin type I domain-containing protein, partial [Planctomycetota bacterium]|nr:dockerin type I domain-containing protein [Planctomycetota bacterium]